MTQLKCLECGVFAREGSCFCETCEPISTEIKSKERTRTRIQSILIMLLFFVIGMVTILAFVLVVVSTAVVVWNAIQGMIV